MMKTPSFIPLFLLNFFLIQVCFAQHYKIELVKDINGSGSSYPSDFVIFKNKLVFASGTRSMGWNHGSPTESTAGTMMLKNINQTGNWQGDDSSNPGEFTVVGDQLFFYAYDNDHWYELWVTDGTEAGTRLVKDIFAGDMGSYPHDLAAFNAGLSSGRMKVTGMNRSFPTELQPGRT